ncbi:Rne/Rng family ribonuclease [Aeromicrobium sp. YIM 150415]|uniref:Rne/Rng family ribonuclease n=1 Tax=Aeromicrobium sp. YIM 150415 TaxID=2803912 RepID=UPI0019634863|nr:Rne/Rng family ribonuclease [Aeromicrobium sp. YIM 150415]MBM9463298.1 Rne/Rng family ribonuclease [Aeromicrobium sp. YIM 150415]
MLDDDNDTSTAPQTPDEQTPEQETSGEAPGSTSTRRRAAGRAAGPPSALSTDIFAAPSAQSAPEPAPRPEPEDAAPERPAAPEAGAGKAAATAAMFQAPPAELAPPKPKPAPEPQSSDEDTDDDDDDSDDEQPKRRRRSRGGRRRRKGGDDSEDTSDETEASDDGADSSDDADDDNGNDNGSGSRRRRRRARAGEGADKSPDDPENTVVKVREGRSAEDEITGVTGSTRLEAKKQRRREGREAGRRRAPIVSEAEFLARRESVTREMVVRQREDYTQIAVLEDRVLVEHYVARESQVSIIGNVYLGRVQNVLPSMEAAFVDIGAGRNAVIYAGEVDWSGVENGKQRKIEDALQPGQTVLVQVTKDPIGQKGARLTSQISLAGRFLVYVPGGGSNGISRKLPDAERSRLKGLLKEVLPENASVIVRTAAEGATEDQLTRDVQALSARWEDIERKSQGGGSAPTLLYSEPDLMIKVVRDLFNEDFAKLVVQGDDAWDMVHGYVDHVAPDLEDRLERWTRDNDVFSEYRLDEQIHKALDRKVHLPSGGSLVIDRTEAMTVVDVNTGKFTGSGGNLEETVTKNNLEAAEEIVRQLRLRDIGGIIVVDFIDMVLESNRDLVLRRLVECLGRDRTRHQVAEVTSLGLVQMTRKRIGTGLLESFSHECEHCKGRGVVIADEPVEAKKDDARRRRGNRGGKGRGNGNGDQSEGSQQDAGKQNGGSKGQDDSAPKRDEDAPAETSQQNKRGGKGKQRGGSGENTTQTQPDTVPEAVKDESAAEAPQESTSAEAEDRPAPRKKSAARSRAKKSAPADAAPEPAAPVEAAGPADEPAAPAEEPAPAAGGSTTRARGRRSAARPKAEQLPLDEPKTEDAEQVAEDVQQAAEEAATPPVAPAPPAKPVVKSTTRRRAATRPASAPDPVVPPTEPAESGPVLTEDGSGQ